MSSIFGWSLPPGVTTLPGEEPDPPCAVCGQCEEDCVCPECPTCGGVGDPYCYRDDDPGGKPPDRSRDRGSYGTDSHGLVRSFAQVALLAEAERQWAADAAAEWQWEQENL